MQVEFFFDCSSPWTYLAFTHIKRVCEENDTSLVWKPILVGGVFNEINQGIYEQRANPVPAKANYYPKDLKDWADYLGIAIGSPSVFPVNSVKAMRGAFVAIEQDCIAQYAEKVFRTYWSDLKDISQDDVLTEMVNSVGLNVEDFFVKISSQNYKDRLRGNTEELMSRGGFGSPTMYLDGDDMYFGNDRIQLLEQKLKQRQVKNP